MHHELNGALTVEIEIRVKVLLRPKPTRECPGVKMLERVLTVLSFEGCHHEKLEVYLNLNKFLRKLILLIVL